MRSRILEPYLYLTAFVNIWTVGLEDEAESDHRWSKLPVIWRSMHCMILAQPSTIPVWNLSTEYGRMLHTLDFKYPQRWGGGGVRCGDLAGHSVGSLRPAHRSTVMLHTDTKSSCTKMRGRTAPSCYIRTSDKESRGRLSKYGFNAKVHFYLR